MTFNFFESVNKLWMERVHWFTLLSRWWYGLSCLPLLPFHDVNSAFYTTKCLPLQLHHCYLQTRLYKEDETKVLSLSFLTQLDLRINFRNCCANQECIDCSLCVWSRGWPCHYNASFLNLATRVQTYLQLMPFIRWR